MLKFKNMKRIDSEHYKICLINNSNLQNKIDNLIKETFDSYCKKKKIYYNDDDVKMDDFNEAYTLSLNSLFKEVNDW